VSSFGVWEKRRLGVDEQRNLQIELTDGTIEFDRKEQLKQDAASSSAASPKSSPKPLKGNSRPWRRTPAIRRILSRRLKAD
jgi:hypothetical protein